MLNQFSHATRTKACMQHRNPFYIYLRPYHLRQYNNHWFLFGKSEEREGLTNLALDCILSIKA